MDSLRNGRGFGVVEVIIIVAVLVLVGFGGWYVWQAQNRVNEQLPANTPSASNNDPAVDPYESWKTYCDDVRKACFKYPADWKVTTDTADTTRYASLTNPTGTSTAQYYGEDTRDGREVDFYAAAIEDLSNTDKRYKIVGGYVTPSGLAPGYWLVSGLFLPSSLQIGTLSRYGDTPRFVNSDGLNAAFNARPSKAFTTEAESKAWFASDDGKTALQIIKSFTQN